MGNSMSEEQCDNRCDKEMRSYQEMEKILREKINKMEDDLDEKDKECKRKLNDFEANLKEERSNWLEDFKKNSDEKKNFCKENCPAFIKKESIESIEQSGMSVAVSNGNFKPPSREDIERYKFINRLKECKKKSKINQKILCYQRIEGVKNSLMRKLLMGNTKPIDLNLINNGITSDLVTTLKSCNSKPAFIKDFCIKRRLEKKKFPIIEYSKEYINKYTDLFEGFENNKEDINVSTLLLILVVTVIILKCCD